MTEIMSIENLKTEITRLEQQSEHFPSILKSLVEQKIRIYKDVIENCTDQESIKSCCNEQISTLRSTAGYLLPIDAAMYCINIYHGILGEEKEKI